MSRRQEAIEDCRDNIEGLEAVLARVQSERFANESPSGFELELLRLLAKEQGKLRRLGH